MILVKRTRSSMVASKGRKRDLKDGNSDSPENKSKVCASSITTMKEKQTSSDESSVEDNKSKKISQMFCSD